MVPRNLRKPTPKRCQFWWDDFVTAWYRLGRWYYDCVVLDDD